MPASVNHEWERKKLSFYISRDFEFTVAKKMADVDFTRMHCDLTRLHSQINVFRSADGRHQVMFTLVLKFQSISFASCNLFPGILTGYLQCILVKSTCRHLFCYGEFRYAWLSQARAVTYGLLPPNKPSVKFYYSSALT